MPTDTVRRAPRRSLAALAVLAAILASPAILAQGAAEPSARTGTRADANSGGTTLDQRLAQEYPSPVGVLPQAAIVPPALGDRELLALEAQLDGASSAGIDARRTVIVDEPPGPVETILLLLASIAVVGFAAAVVTLAVRQLQKDNEQRKRESRRRLRPRDPTPPGSHVTAN